MNTSRFLAGAVPAPTAPWSPRHWKKVSPRLLRHRISLRTTVAILMDRLSVFAILLSLVAPNPRITNPQTDPFITKPTKRPFSYGYPLHIRRRLHDTCSIKSNILVRHRSLSTSRASRYRYSLRSSSRDILIRRREDALCR